MSDMQRETVPHLAEAVERRRKELGYTPGTFAAAAGITAPGLAPLRRGERRNYSEAVRLGVTAALRWTPDSIDRLLQGQPPMVLPTPPDVPADIDAQLRQLLETVALGRAENAALGALVDRTVKELHSRIDTVELALHPTKAPRRTAPRQPVEQ